MMKKEEDKEADQCLLTTKYEKGSLLLIHMHY